MNLEAPHRWLVFAQLKINLSQFSLGRPRQDNLPSVNLPKKNVTVEIFNTKLSNFVTNLASPIYQCSHRINCAWFNEIIVWRQSPDSLPMGQYNCSICTSLITCISIFMFQSHYNSINTNGIFIFLNYRANLMTFNSTRHFIYLSLLPSKRVVSDIFSSNIVKAYRGKCPFHYVWIGEPHSGFVASKCFTKGRIAF